MKLAIYHQQYHQDFFQDFLETLDDMKLQFLASDLIHYGLHGPIELENAVSRAMKVCAAGGLALRSNFKAVYYCREDGSLYRDWRLSDLGRKLVMLNAHPSNPLVAKLQIELIRQLG